MAEENVNSEVTTGAEATVGNTTDSNATSSLGTDGAAPADTSTASAPAEKGFDELDVANLTPEQLVHYKHFQGLYTKARQKDTEKFGNYDELSKQSQILNQIVSDPELFAKVKAKLNGEPEAVAETQPDLDINDPYLAPETRDAVMQARQEARAATQMAQGIQKQLITEKAHEDTKAFYEALGDDKPLFLEKANEVTDVVNALSASKLSNKQKLDLAWKAVSKDMAYEKGKKEALAKFEQKKTNVPAETNSSTGGITKKAYSNFREAAEAAERILASQGIKIDD